MDPRIVERETRRDLPGDVRPQRRRGARSDKPSNAWRTITVATTSAGTDGRPRPDGNKSANSSSANSSRR